LNKNLIIVTKNKHYSFNIDKYVVVGYDNKKTGGLNDGFD